MRSFHTEKKLQTRDFFYYYSKTWTGLQKPEGEFTTTNFSGNRGEFYSTQIHEIYYFCVSTYEPKLSSSHPTVPPQKKHEVSKYKRFHVSLRMISLS